MPATIVLQSGGMRGGRGLSLLESLRDPGETPCSFSGNGDVITLAAKRVYSQLVQFRHANVGFQCAVLPGGMGQKARGDLQGLVPQVLFIMERTPS